MPSEFTFEDWFKKKEEYHRISAPNNTVLADFGLYSFTTGTLYDTLLANQNIVVSGGGYDVVWSGVGVNYDEAFASGQYTNILKTNPSYPAKVDTFQQYTDGSVAEVRKDLDTEYDNTIHGGSGVLGAIINHEEWVPQPSGSGVNWQGKKDFFFDVATSESGIFWEVPLLFRLGTSGVDGADCIKGANVTFFAQLYDDDYHYSSERLVALKGDGVDGPIIAMAAPNKYGKPGKPTGTPGVSQVIEEGGLDNPNNAIAAPMDLYYNENTGKLEAGTRLMAAVLLTEFFGVGVKPINVEAVNEKKLKQLVEDKDDEEYQGDFELGRAMPISVKGSNPHHYGPDADVEDCDKNRKNTIVVVNRSTSSYNIGQRVMCGYIGGEWLILFPMDEAEGMSFKMKGFSDIYYMMAHTDSYFLGTRSVIKGGWMDYGFSTPHDTYDENNERHAYRYHTLNTYPPVRYASEGGKSYLNSQEYQDAFKRSFYEDVDKILSAGHPADFWRGSFFSVDRNMGELFPVKLLDTMLQQNIGSERNAFTPNYGYYQYTSFDMMSDQLGGINKYNLLGSTNPLVMTDGTTNPGMGESNINWMWPYAGISFFDGFRTDKVNVLANENPQYKSNTNSVKRRNNLYNYGPAQEYITTGAIGEAAESMYTAASGQFTRDAGSGINKNLAFGSSDDNVYGIWRTAGSTLQIPADIALNASPSGEWGKPLKSLRFLKECIRFGSGLPTERARYRMTNAGQPPTSFSTRGLAGGVADYFCGETFPEHNHTSLNIGGEVDSNGNSILRRDHWLSFEDSQGQYDSLYDLQPNNPMRFAFVPLNAEAYFSFDYPKFGTHQAANPAENSEIYVNTQARTYQSPGAGLAINFPAGSGGLETGSSHPSDSLFGPRREFLIDREATFNPTADWLQDGHNMFMTTQPLDVEVNDGTNTTVVTTPSRNILPYGAYLYEHNMWFDNSRTTLHYKHGPFRDAGAIWEGGMGVCGIQTMKMKFQTPAAALKFQCVHEELGTDKIKTFSVSSHNDGFAAGPVVLLPGSSNETSSSENAQYGATAYDLRSWNTDLLFAKVCDGWPEDQTLFDPRYFAVMHFNPKPDMLLSAPEVVFYSGGAPILIGGKKVYLPQSVEGAKRNISNFGYDANGDPIVDPAEIIPNFSNADFNDYANGTFVAEEIDLDVDFRVPTVQRPYASVQCGEAVPSGGGDVYGDVLDNNGFYKVWRDFDHWRVNPVRRGMLLPFRWEQTTITCGASTIIVNSGEKYKVGNTFRASSGSGGNGAIYKVSAIGPSGEITSMEMVSKTGGSLYRPTDFPTIGQVDELTKWAAGDPNADSDIKNAMTLTPEQVVGRNATIVVEHGAMSGIINTDAAPQQRATTRLSLSDNGDGSSAPGLREPRNGRIDGSSQTSLMLDNPPANREYDVFFHFHNDLSYTVRGTNSYSPAWLRFLSVEFSPVDI